MSSDRGRFDVAGSAVSDLVATHIGEKVPLVLLERSPTELESHASQAGDDWTDVNVPNARLLHEFAVGSLGGGFALMYAAARQVPVRGLIGTGRILCSE
jgi:hypothetical protein